MKIFERGKKRDKKDPITIFAICVFNIAFFKGYLKLRTAILVVCCIGILINTMFKRFRNEAFKLSAMLMYSTLILHSIQVYAVGKLNISVEISKAIDIFVDILSVNVLFLCSALVIKHLANRATEVLELNNSYVASESVWLFTEVVTCVFSCLVSTDILNVTAKVIICIVYTLVSRIIVVMVVERTLLLKEGQLIRG